MFDLRVIDAKVQGSIALKTKYHAFWYTLDHDLEDRCAYAYYARTSNIGSEPGACAEPNFARSIQSLSMPLQLRRD